MIANGAVYASVLLVSAGPAVLILIRYPILAVMIWLLLFPYFLSSSMAGVATMHWVLHRALIPVTLGFVVISGWLGIGRRESVRPGPAEWSMLAFLTVSLVSIFLWSQQPVRSTSNLYDRVFVPFCAYWLLRLTVRGMKDLERFLGVVLITLVAQVSISLSSWFAPQVLPPAYQFTAWSQGRTVGTLRTAEVFSSTVVFLALLLYHYALSCGAGWRRRLLVALFSLTVFAVFLSFSRSSWVGVAAVLAGLLLIYPKTTSRLILVLVLLAVIVGGSFMADEFAWAYERLTSELAQRSVGGRVIVNNAMIEMAKERPFFGWGYNRYRYYISQYKVPVGEISVVGRWHITSHNSYLTIMAELGVPALLIYLLPAGWWLFKSLQARKWLPGEGFWSWRLVAVLWLALLHMFIEGNSVDMMSHNPFGTTLWWMALGLIATVVGPRPSVERPSPMKPSGTNQA
ncbi:O-antigen ligase family protein [Chloroflexota bacterium]